MEGNDVWRNPCHHGLASADRRLVPTARVRSPGVTRLLSTDPAPATVNAEVRVSRACWLQVRVGVARACPATRSTRQGPPWTECPSIRRRSPPTRSDRDGDSAATPVHRGCPSSGHEEDMHTPHSRPGQGSIFFSPTLWLNNIVQRPAVYNKLANVKYCHSRS